MRRSKPGGPWLCVQCYRSLDPPRTYGECLDPQSVDSERPCPYAACRYWMPGAENEGCCALDYANAAEGKNTGMHLEEIGVLLNLSRERVRQVQDKALRKLVAKFSDASDPEIQAAVQAITGTRFTTSTRNERVDPAKPPRVIRCSTCRQTGHNIQNCPVSNTHRKRVQGKNCRCGRPKDGSEGHAPACREVTRTKQPRRCRSCRQLGHNARSCPRGKQ